MHFWYQARKTWLAYLLWPLACLYRVVLFFRALAYRCHLLKTHQFKVPIIVVGNLTVGGTGKTPLVIALAKHFQQQHIKVGIISRGYGGRQITPALVSKMSQASQFGDEPVLIAQRCDCPVVVARKRAEAARFLLENSEVDVIISDDGLQHKALGKALELVVVDSERQFGNGLCLPAGPLRESIKRLKTVDAIIINGGKLGPQSIEMQLIPGDLRALSNESVLPLANCQSKNIVAFAGIGHPKRFFDTLKKLGLAFTEKTYPDHYAFKQADVAFPQADIIIMTEKDAIKCRDFADERHYYLAVEARLPQDFLTELDAKVSSARRK